jgi:multiple sugar transport system substrate-binding protein
LAAVVEFWAMAIPRNAGDKALGWDFIRAMSTQAATLAAARNGNGPVRVSTYDDAGFNAQLPTAAVESRALAKARVPYPAFAEASRAQSVFVEEMQAAILARKTPAQAVQDTIARVKPLLPA